MWLGIGISTCFLAAVLLLIVATSRHNKHASSFHSLPGRRGNAFGDLNPAGTVLIDGEMWPAEVVNGKTIEDGQSITVKGARLTHLLVEELSKVPLL